jgi:predicted XRE-type DNA-binding protein
MTKKVNYNFPTEEIRKELKTKASLVNIVLPKNASFSEQVKHEIAQTILAYQQDNKLSHEQTAQKLGLALSQTMEILRGNTAPFALDSLIAYAEHLQLPLQIKISTEKESILHA